MDWTDDDVRAAIKECHDIVREDRDRARYAELHGKYGTAKEDDESEDKPEGGIPPAKTKEDSTPKSRSIWWGERE
jgi:hypothetical protein